jgi:predicted nucleic acid-binding protein
MNWLLDTDVASQASKPKPDPRVMVWMERHADEVFLSALTVAEISYGVLIAPAPKRTKLREFIERLCREHRDAILPVNEAVLVRWKQLLAGLKASGRVLSCEDTLLAAHALELGFGVATLNVTHFKAAGVACAEF